MLVLMLVSCQMDRTEVKPNAAYEIFKVDTAKYTLITSQNQYIMADSVLIDPDTFILTDQEKRFTHTVNIRNISSQAIRLNKCNMLMAAAKCSQKSKSINVGQSLSIEVTLPLDSWRPYERRQLNLFLEPDIVKSIHYVRDPLAQ